MREWVGSSLDAWVIEREVLDPLAYAELWVRDGGPFPGTPEYARLIDAWLDDFAARGVTGVGFGYVLLRRPLAGGPTLARYERVSGGGESAFGPHLSASLAAHDRAALLDDDGLASSVLRVAPDVTEARHHTDRARRTPRSSNSDRAAASRARSRWTRGSRPSSAPATATWP